jgi:hypothetical protein
MIASFSNPIVRRQTNSRVNKTVARTIVRQPTFGALPSAPQAPGAMHDLYGGSDFARSVPGRYTANASAREYVVYAPTKVRGRLESWLSSVCVPHLRWNDDMWLALGLFALCLALGLACSAYGAETTFNVVGVVVKGMLVLISEVLRVLGTILKVLAQILALFTSSIGILIGLGLVVSGIAIILTPIPCTACIGIPLLIFGVIMLIQCMNAAVAPLAHVA